ncbi:hypothetical protein LTR17_012607 [Elasticomyces elasticus]|nr:hypothetical protein LTR17_012607 [Elasticomyces elasticus]
MSSNPAQAAEQTILQLALELRAARTEAKNNAAALVKANNEIEALRKEVKDATATENSAHTQYELDLNHKLAEASAEIELLHIQARDDQKYHERQLAAMRKKLGRAGELNDSQGTVIGELREKLHKVGAEKDVLEADKTELIGVLEKVLNYLESQEAAGGITADERAGRFRLQPPRKCASSSQSSRKHAGWVGKTWSTYRTVISGED